MKSLQRPISKWNCSLLKTKLESSKVVQIPSQLSGFKQAVFIFKLHNMHSLKKEQEGTWGARRQSQCQQKQKILTNYREIMKRMVAKKNT